jgi:D-glycero-alpha-D-manno-heptose-7-phosphate kinase
VLVVRTPLRVSFVGGGSDLPAYYRHSPGAVVTTAIDCFVQVTVDAASDGSCTLAHDVVETAETWAEIRNEIAREVFRRFGGVGGIHVSINCGVPAGTGLGSSSTLTVALLHAVGRHCGISFTPEQLAQEACRIEMEHLGRPVGKQDQYAAAYGGLNFLRFETDDSVIVERISQTPDVRQHLNERLLFFFAGIRGDCCSLLSEQQEIISSSADRRRVLDQMADLAWEMRDALVTGDLRRFGPSLHRNWELKRSLHPRISSRKIDQYYETALRAGAEGGKILGAGGGGFLFLYCEPAYQPAVCNAMQELGLKHVRFAMTEAGSTLLADGCDDASSARINAA